MSDDAQGSDGIDSAGKGTSLVRFRTHVPGLDSILGGGLYEGEIYLIEGAPGSGKTLLASQLSFGLAEAGKSVVYLTLLAESHAKLVSHLSTMRFFRRSHLGTKIHLLSGFQELRSGGYRALLEFIAAIVREHKPFLLVMDGFRHAGITESTDSEISIFVHDLGAFAMTARCTVLLLTPPCGRIRPEDALVDGLIGLTRQTAGMRSVRELEAHKMRATAYMQGRHFFKITADGLSVFPRLEGSIGETLPTAEDPTRLVLDIPKLDAMLQGGLFKGSVTSLAGSPGSGKTLLSLCFLVAGARRRESGLYFGFYESPARLVAKAEAVGLPVRSMIDAGLLHIVWQPTSELLLDELAQKLIAAVEEHGVQRLVIDGVEGFRTSAVYPDRINRFIVALTTLLRLKSVTSIMTEELPIFSRDIPTPVTELSAIVENLILMRQVELRSQLYRLISIMKLRESGYDAAIREFTISSKGIDVASSFTSAEAILSGQARVRPDVGKRGRRRPSRKRT